MSRQNKSWKRWKNAALRPEYDNDIMNEEKRPKKVETVGEIGNLINKIHSILNKYPNPDMAIGEIEENEYREILSGLTRLLWKFKSTQSYSQNSEDKYDSKRLDEEHILIEHSGDYIVKITTPLLYPNKYAGAYLTATAIENALSKYIAAHQILPPKGQRIIMVFERFVCGDMREVCDNDNYEQRRVTNAVANCLGVSDAYDSMSFFYTAWKCNSDEAKSVILVMGEKQFAQYCKRLGNPLT